MVSFVSLLLRLGVVAALLTALVGQAGELTWRMLEAPRFTVYSQLSDDRTLEWAEEFSQFAEELLKLLATSDAQLPPLTVVIFARDREFTPYKGLRPDGRAPRDIAGFFKRRETWSVVGLAGGYRNDEVRGLIFHEGVHWATSAFPMTLPVWLDEGLAEVFSTFRQRGNKVQWGAVIENHVLVLRRDGLMPLEHMLFLNRKDSLFNEGARTSAFYAQSWLFVHYALYGRHQGSRTPIDDYLRGLRKSPDLDGTFRAAFGGDYRAVQRDLRDYLQRGSFTMPQVEASASRLSGLHVRPAPAHCIEAALARLALGPDTYALARTHADRAVSLAPDQPEGYEARAAWAHETGHFDFVRAACERAVGCGTKDPGTLLLLARDLMRDAPPGQMTGQAARELADIFERAIAVAPSTESAYEGLASTVRDLTELGQAEVDALKQGARRFPRNGTIVFGIALMLGKVGEFDQAREVLKVARTRHLDEGSERFANELDRDWLYQADKLRIESLMKSGDTAGALTLCDELLPQLRGTPNYAPVFQARNRLAAQMKLKEAEARRAEGKTDEARKRRDAFPP